MTQPNPEQQGTEQQSGGRSSGKKAKVGDVVSFTRQDPILRREHSGVGVVVAVDDQGVEVRPLERHTVRLDQSEATPIAADDV